MDAALGAESAGGAGTPAFDVPQNGADPARLKANHPAGNAGGTALSKFSVNVPEQATGVGVTDGVGVGDGEGVPATVAVAVAVAVGVGDGLDAPPLQKNWTLSILQPVLETVRSLAMRQRRTTVCPLAAAGRFTRVFMNPLELPVQACRPAIGLLNDVDIVPT